MTKQKGSTTLSILMTVLFLAGVFGWVWNIIKIVNAGFDVFTGMMLARCIGVFLAPLGAVLGFL